MHGRGVVRGGGARDRELPVLGLLRQPVLDHHHGTDHVGALDVRDVEAFDPHQRDRQLEGLLQFLERLGPHGQIAGAPGFVQLEGVLGVLPDGGQQGGLVAALRHPDVHPGPAQPAEPLRQLRGVAGLRRDEDLAGQPALEAGFLAVDLLEQVLDEVRGGGVLDLFDDPAALAADPAAADVEDLHGGFEFILVQGEDVGVGALGEDDGVAFEDLLERDDVVADPRRPLVVQFRHGGGHVLFQPRDERLGLAAHEGAEVLGQGAVVLGRDAADAGRRALVDVAEQAGPAAGFGPFQDAGAAAADREDAQQGVHGVADGTGGVRAEVAGALAAFAAQDLDPGVLLPHGDGQVRVAFVVPEHHVEPGLEFLDPGVFELQRLELAADDGPLDAAGRVDHRIRFGEQPGRVGEVGVQPRTEVLGLADIDDPAVRVAEAVHARIGRNLTRLGSVTRWICHSSSLLSLRRCPGRRRAGARMILRGLKYSGSCVPIRVLAESPFFSSVLDDLMRLWKARSGVWRAGRPWRLSRRLTAALASVAGAGAGRADLSVSELSWSAPGPAAPICPVSDDAGSVFRVWPQCSVRCRAVRDDPLRASGGCVPGRPGRAGAVRGAVCRVEGAAGRVLRSGHRCHGGTGGVPAGPLSARRSSVVRRGRLCADRASGDRRCVPGRMSVP